MLCHHTCTLIYLFMCLCVSTGVRFEEVQMECSVKRRYYTLPTMLDSLRQEILFCVKALEDY